MGGKAFTSDIDGAPGLHVPRMEPDVYFRLKSRYIELLSTLFRMVDCPIDAPAKRSYGDIDIVVADPDDTLFTSIWNDLPWERRIKSRAPTAPEVQKDVLVGILDAKRHSKNGSTWSFAVPHPEQTDAFVQLDVSEQPTHLHAWHVFHQSHGDLWNILGTSIRAFGLTATEDGLYARDPEIEHLDRKRARTLLTRDPRASIEFLGLDFEVWNRVWSSEEGMFSYAAQSKFFVPELYLSKGDLKANDRKRLRERPCFRNFVENFIPNLIKQREMTSPGRHDIQYEETSNGQNERIWCQVDRIGALEQALEHFNAHDSYNENRQKWLNEREELERKWAEKAARKANSLPVDTKGYDRHWIDWFLDSLGDEERRSLSLDMYKSSESAGAAILRQA